MKSLCKYKDIFGVPEKGIHKYRIFGLAAVDIVETIIGAAILSYFLRVPFWLVFIFAICLAEIMHLMFCVDTPITRLITNRINE